MYSSMSACLEMSVLVLFIQMYAYTNDICFLWISQIDLHIYINNRINCAYIWILFGACGKYYKHLLILGEDASNQWYPCTCVFAFEVPVAASIWTLVMFQ